MGNQEEVGLTQTRLHWYYFTFMFNSDGGGMTFRDHAAGWSSQELTINRIKEAKKLAAVPDNSVIINLSYMGYMTAEDHHTE